MELIKSLSFKGGSYQIAVRSMFPYIRLTISSVLDSLN